MGLWLKQRKLRGVSPPKSIAEISIFNTKFSNKNLREETKMLNLYFESKDSRILDSQENGNIDNDISGRIDCRRITM